MARKSEYTDEIAERICELIATTPRGLDWICSNNDELPSAATVHRWLADNKTFCESYLRARERQAALLFDECLEIADDSTDDILFLASQDDSGDGGKPALKHSAIARAKLRIDTRMRMAGKLHPKKYGDKLDLNHGGQPENPVNANLTITFADSVPAEAEGAVPTESL
jgi:hypothetical protein